MWTADTQARGLGVVQDHHVIGAHQLGELSPAVQQFGDRKERRVAGDRAERSIRASRAAYSAAEIADSKRWGSIAATSTCSSAPTPNFILVGACPQPEIYGSQVRGEPGCRQPSPPIACPQRQQ